MTRKTKIASIFSISLISLLFISLIVAVKNPTRSYAISENTKINALVCSGGKKHPVAHIKASINNKKKELTFNLNWINYIKLTADNNIIYEKKLPTFQANNSFKKSFNLADKVSLALTLRGGCPESEITRTFNLDFEKENEYSTFVDLNEYCYDDLSPEITGKVYGTNDNFKVNINGKEYEAINNKDNTWIIPKNTIDKLNIADETIKVEINDLNNTSTTLNKYICFTILDDHLLPPNTGYNAK